MTETNQPPSDPARDVVPSKKGVINREELAKVYRSSKSWAIAIAALVAAVTESAHYLLANVDKIYTGPGAATVASIAGVLVFWWRMKATTDKVIEDGE